MQAKRETEEVRICEGTCSGFYGSTLSHCGNGALRIYKHVADRLVPAAVIHSDTVSCGLGLPT